MQVLRPESLHGEALVEARHELGKELVAGNHTADFFQSKLLHKPILQRAVGSLNATLGPA